jgi:hypothetical protein
LSSTDWNTFNSGVSIANTATSANVASTIVKRDASGNFTAGGITAATTLGVGGSVGANTQLQSTATSASNVGLVVQGAASQTADLMDIKNSLGSILVSINSAGNVNITGNIGIGTTASTAPLTINGVSGTAGIQYPDGSVQTAATNMHHLLFYTSSGTFTVPANVTWVKVTLMGGGGGGASTGNSCPSFGGGGGSGGYCEAYMSVTPGANISYTVGAAGTPTAAGGASTFVAGATPTANGGGFGTNSTAGTGGTTSGCAVGITGFTTQSPYPN